MSSAGTFLKQVRDITGEVGLVSEDQYEAYLNDRRGYYQGQALAIVRPESTEAVSRIVALCNEHKVAVVPQGGNTGLCGGATPDNSGKQVVLSLNRLDRIREIDPVDCTATVESGVVLQQLHRAAEERELMFPLDLAAKGSCQIGGNLSTNAGGINVLRYGNARELVLGLEVVLPDGRIWNGLSKLRKDNTGYDLKQLFIGAEGTLGIITAAVLKLFPTPGRRHTALVAVADPAAGCRLLAMMRRLSADALVSFEYLPGFAMELVGRTPLGESYSHYVLVELVAPAAESELEMEIEARLALAMESGEILDAVVAQSGEQRNQLWEIRENLPLAQKESVKNDVSVPISRIPDLLERAAAAVEAVAPGARPCPFGHIGDGNIHYNILGPADTDPVEFRQNYGNALVTAINELVIALDGSVSAEHGVGQLRRQDLRRYKTAIEIELMQRIKSVLDPGNVLNPGKVL